MILLALITHLVNLSKARQFSRVSLKPSSFFTCMDFELFHWSSSNLSALKVTSRVCGAYGSSDKAEQYVVQPWFKNSLDPEHI